MTEWTVAIGVDTHKEVHVAVALDQVGAQIDTCTVAATPVGYRHLLTWAMGLGSPVFGVEGCGSCATTSSADEAAAIADRDHALHWPLAFPEVFSRERRGFDAVIGNPPWDEVTIEERGFKSCHPCRSRVPEPGRRSGVQGSTARR